MKKLSLFSALTFALFGLLGCQANDEMADGNNQQFSIYASTSRTQNSGMNTLWATDDSINILHAPTGSNAYVADGEFSLADAAKGRFVGNLSSELSAGASYDWYACYPYTEGLTSPCGTFVIGAAANSHQTQNGNNSTAHLAGENMPLIGAATVVKSTDAPSLQMKNAASMIKFVIRNNFGASATIKSVELSAPGHNILGSFDIDFKDISNPKYTPIDTSEKAALEVVNGASIAQSGEVTLYMAIAPFAASKGEDITFKVTALTAQGESKICEKTHHLTGNLTFTAGLCKEVVLNCGEELEVVKLSLDELPPMSSESSKLRARIMCYNIRNCKGSDSVIDYKRVANVISRCNADVVALQEVDSVTGRHPLDLSKHLGDMTGHHATFGAAVNYSGGKYGVAVLSKEKPLSWRTVKLPCSDEERVFLIVEFEDYYFCSTHFSLLEEYRLKAVEIIAEEVAKLNKPVFIAGDLNALPDSSVLTNLRQYFNIFTKSGSALTFPASAPNREIDYIGLYKNANYSPIIYEHYVVNAPVESDHRPILADVEVF